MEIAFIGGGIVGLGLALNLHQRGMACRVYGAMSEINEFGAARVLAGLFRDIPVEKRTGDRPFGNLDDFISQGELRALSDRYKRIAGYSIEDLATGSATAN